MWNDIITSTLFPHTSLYNEQFNSSSMKWIQTHCIAGKLLTVNVKYSIFSKSSILVSRDMFMF